MNESAMKVSVLMRTYNRSSIIHKSIDAILSQKTNFEWELIIQDDCSTDNTQKICQEYEQKNKNFVRYFKNKKNIGVTNNLLSGFNNTQGEYIAMGDDDDIWIDEYKLQSQYDFLNNNKQYVMHHHNCILVNEEHTEILGYGNNFNSSCDRSITELWENSAIYCPTVMFKKAALPEFPIDYEKYLPEDWHLFLYLANKGKIRYTEKIMVKCSIGNGGWSGKSQFYRELLTAQMLAQAYCNFGYQYKKYIIKIILYRFYNLMKYMEKHIDYIEKELSMHPLLVTALKDFLKNVEKIERMS